MCIDVVCVEGGFSQIRSHLSKCSSQFKESAYLTMVRPQLEYAYDVWDPYYVGDIMELEKVQ